MKYGQESQIRFSLRQSFGSGNQGLLAICLISGKSGLVWRRNQPVQIARGQDIGTQEIKKDYRPWYLSYISLWVIFMFISYKSQENNDLDPGPMEGNFACG